MKRIGNIYDEICAIENLEIADKKASRGKHRTKDVIRHLETKDRNLQYLQHLLQTQSFTTSKYRVFTIKDPKEREIYSLPYFPDRIVHHAVMNILEPYFLRWFTADTYSSIPGKGLHLAGRKIKKALSNISATRYCLKIDIKKFYPSINNEILKALLRRKIKDDKLLYLLDDVIDSCTGLPIGNYLSQYLANFYLTPLDIFIKQQLGIKYYYRYADDMVILHRSKRKLHHVLHQIRSFLKIDLDLHLKSNYQVFPVAARGIDFLGYRFYHTHILLRKSIKKRFVRMLKSYPNSQSIASYKGWLKHCNSKNLINKLWNSH